MDAPAPRIWRFNEARSLSLDRSRLMAVLNLTPDSFSDGGELAGPRDAARAAQRAIETGADILDIGGESTRPGADPVDPAEQIRRTAPAIRAIRAAGIDAPITIDTTSAEVARAALDAGADAINDVSAGLDDPEMFELAAQRGVGIALMHRLRPPREDRYSHELSAAPDYGDEGVVAHVRAWLKNRVNAAIGAGVAPSGIAIDPGLGFGKTVEQNYELMRRVGEFVADGRPTLVGASRKSFIGAATGVREPGDRVWGSVAAAVAMRLAGASIFRVHDVGPHRQALDVADATLGPPC